MSRPRRIVTTVISTAAAMTLAAGPALAHTCVNASKPADAGVQIVFGPEGDVVWVANGLDHRMTNGVVSPDGEGFHGLIGFDFDGDGAVDVSTWIDVGPDGQIPVVAQDAGPACRGIVNGETFFRQCLGPQ